MSFFYCFLLFIQHCNSVTASKRWLGNFTEKYFNRIKEIGQLLFMLIVSNRIVSLEGKNAWQNKYLQMALPTIQVLLFLKRKVFLSRRYVVIDMGTRFRVHELQLWIYESTNHRNVNRSVLCIMLLCSRCTALVSGRTVDWKEMGLVCHAQGRNRRKTGCRSYLAITWSSW